MRKQTPEQLGICSWSTHPADPQDLAGRVAELGLKRVQLHLNPLVDSPQVWRDVQAVLERGSVTIVSGMFTTHGEDYATLETIRATGGVVPDQHWQANLATATAVADQAQRLGLKMVSFHAGFIPHDPADPVRAKLLERLARLADLFADRGSALLLETGQERAEDLDAFLDELGHPGVGVNFDPANMILYGMGDPIASLSRLRPRVRQVHIKDAKATTEPGTWGTEVPIGRGDVDWAAFINVLAETDYDASMVVEREAGPDRVGDVRTAVQVITQAMS